VFYQVVDWVVGDLVGSAMCGMWDRAYLSGALCISASRISPDSRRGSRSLPYFSARMVTGGFAEGIPRLLAPLREKFPYQDSLHVYARLLVAEAYSQRGDRDSALILYEEIAQRAPQLTLRAYAALRLGSLYVETHPAKAMVFASQADEELGKGGAPLHRALARNLLSVLIAGQGDYTRAIAFAQEAKALIAQAGDTPDLLWGEPRTIAAAITANLASLYQEKGRLAESRKLYEEALRTAQMQQDTLGIAQAYLGLAQLALQSNDPAAALNQLRQAEPLRHKLPLSLLKEWYRTVAQAHFLLRQYKEAMATYEKLSEALEKELQATLASRAQQLQVLSGLTQREVELKALELQRSRERFLYGVLGGVMLFVLVLLGYGLYYARRRAREERSLRQMIAQQAVQIDEQNKRLTEQAAELQRLSDSLLETIEELKRSHTAAQRLQASMLPPVEKLLPESAIYYEPMQEVSGDFYLLVSDTFSKRLLFAVGDCTGHGVVGALLTGIFSTNLQSFFFQNPQQMPQTLLSRLVQVLSALFGTAKKGYSEGAELVVGIADFSQQKVYLATAGRPIWVSRSSHGLEEWEGGRLGVTAETPVDYIFPTYELDLRDDFVIYLFTDGISDVLNESGKRLGRKALREMMERERWVRLSSHRQKELIVELLRNWQGQAPPNDDRTLWIIPSEALRKYGAERLRAFV